MTPRKMIFVAVPLAALAGAWWVMTSGGPDRDGAPARGDRERAVAVEAGRVRFEDIQDIAEYTGSLRARSEFTVSARTGGRIRSLRVDIGDSVEQGEVIAELDDEEHVLEVEEARAALAVAEAELEDAQARRDVRRREFERMEVLREDGVVSEEEYDVAASEAAAAEANVRVQNSVVTQREASLRAAQVRESYTRIRASWDDNESGGSRYVGERHVDEGDNISANEPIVSVLNTAALRGVTFVSDRDLARMQRGQPVEIRSDAWPGETFSGEVRRISPQLQEDTRQARVEVDVSNEEGRLSPGFFVNMAITVQEIENARVVPRDALARYQGERGIFLIEEDEMDDDEIVEDEAGEEVEDVYRARFMPVVRGVETRDHVQILEPEIEGRVVTLGQHRLGDGSRVRVTEER